MKHTRKHLIGTTEVAMLLGVSIRTVSKLIDRGTLPGLRLPHSRHRRVYREELERFAEKYGFVLLELVAGS